MSDTQIQGERLESEPAEGAELTTEGLDKVISEVYADEDWAGHLRDGEVKEAKADTEAEAEAEPEKPEPKKAEAKKAEKAEKAEPKKEAPPDPKADEARRRFVAAEKAERKLHQQRKEFETRVGQLEALDKQMREHAAEVAAREKAFRDDPLGTLRRLGITPERVLADHIRASGDKPTPELEAQVREQQNASSVESKILSAIDDRLSKLGQSFDQRLEAIAQAQQERAAEQQREAQTRSMTLASSFVVEHSDDYPILASYEPEEIGEQMLEIGLEKNCSLSEAAQYIENELSQRLLPAIERYAAKRQQVKKTPRQGAKSDRATSRAIPEESATRTDDPASTTLAPDELIEQRWAEVEADFRAGKIPKM